MSIGRRRVGPREFKISFGAGRSRRNAGSKTQQNKNGERRSTRRDWFDSSLFLLRDQILREIGRCRFLDDFNQGIAILGHFGADGF